MILFTGGGRLSHCMLGYTPSRYTSPQVHPQAGTHTPGRYTPQQVYLLVQCMLGYGQEGGGTHPTGMQSCYQLQRSCGQGYVFTCVCDSVNRGVSASVYAGIPPWEQTPPQADTPQSRPPRADPPLEQTHPREQTPPWSRHPPGADTLRSRHPHPHPPGADTPPSRLRHTVNERPVRIYWNAFLFINVGELYCQCLHSEFTKNICDVVAKFLLGVMILNMIQIVQAAFANVLHTSTTIRKPLPPKLKKFLAFLSCPRKEETDDRKPQRNGGQKNVILIEQGNAIANLNANDKEGIETEGSKNADGKQAGETDKMLDGGGGEKRARLHRRLEAFLLVP